MRIFVLRRNDAKKKKKKGSLFYIWNASINPMSKFQVLTRKNRLDDVVYHPPYVVYHPPYVVYHPPWANTET